MNTEPDLTAHQWDLRVPSAEQLRAYSTPINLAFGGGMSDAEMDDWLSLAEPDRWVVAFESPESELAAGTASAFSLRLTVPGAEIPVAAVTGVGVRPDHHRRGILRALMRRQLEDVRERGESVAILWASEGTIYQRFGYGMGAMDGSLEVATARTGFGPRHSLEGGVRIVEEGESATLIPAVYDAMRVHTPGALTRSPAWWSGGRGVLSDPEHSRHGAGPKFRVVYEAEGQPEGYAIYRVKDDWDHRGPKGVLEVDEAVTVTPRATRGLWRYLFDVDLVRTVKAHRVQVPSPLQYVLAEPRALGLVAGDGLWVRLVDLPAALAARRYGAVDSLVFDVADAFCPWNAGRWQIATNGTSGEAEAHVVRTEAEPDLVLDISDLGAIYLGGTQPDALATAGRIEERTEGAVARASRMFAAEQSPWCVMMF